MQMCFKGKNLGWFFGIVIFACFAAFTLMKRGGLQRSSSVFSATYVCSSNTIKCSDGQMYWCTDNVWVAKSSCTSGECNSSGSACKAVTPICTENATKCVGARMYKCDGGSWVGQYTCSSETCNSAGTACAAPAPTTVGCSSSTCYKCMTSLECGNVGCLWGYNGSASLRCYSKGEAIPTPTPKPSGCVSILDGGIVIPDGYIKCGIFSTSALYKCVNGDWVEIENCNTSGRSGTDPTHCMNSGNPAAGDFVDSGCSTNEYCTQAGGTCIDSGSTCSNGSFRSGLCLDSSDGSYDTKSCCVPDSLVIECDPNNGGDARCEALYDVGYTCVSGVCQPPGGGTNCTAVNGRCSTSAAVCNSGSSSGGDFVPTSTGMDYVWSCYGSCRGSNASCSIVACVNQPKVNGACKTTATSDDVTNHTLCVRGSESNVSTTETTITWDCLGSTNTCAEGDGTDALNCTSAVDQKSWFQVNDGSILTKGKVENYIPQTTCDTNGQNCASTVNNGAIYSKSSSSPSGSDRVSVTSESGFNFKTYTYNQLKSDYFDKKGVGSVFEENADWSNVKNVNKVAFVNGDLEINSDLDTSNFVMVIAKGKITIDPSVSKVNAILVGNEVVAKSTDDGSTDAVNQLVVNGMVHGVSGVKFTRNLYPNNLNNTTPSVVVNYKPELLFMIPQELTKAFSQWKIN